MCAISRTATESMYTVYARWELVEKSGHELVLQDVDLAKIFPVNAVSLGYVRDLTHGNGIDVHRLRARGTCGEIGARAGPARCRSCENFSGQCREPWLCARSHARQRNRCTPFTRAGNLWRNRGTSWSCKMSILRKFFRSMP